MRCTRLKTRSKLGPRFVDGDKINSIDTNASSSVKRNGRGRDGSDREASDSDSDSDASDGAFGSGGEDDDDGDERGSDASSSVEIPSKMASIGFRDADDLADADSDGDSDEPPEIPGSPMATQATRAPSSQPSGSVGQMNRLSEVDIGNCGEASRQRIQESKGANTLKVHGSDDSSDSDGDDDDYVVKETEQPRSAEFHASSSSESDDDDESDEGDEESDGDGNNGHHATRRAPKNHSQQASYNSRPKTAAKDLECYRDAIPDEFFQQIGDIGEPLETSNKKSSKQQTQSRSSDRSSNNGSNGTDSSPATTPKPAAAITSSRQKYAVPVPQEVENLFQLIDTYTPEEIEIGTRLEPFVPDFIPTIGLPFDGIQIPRPDGKIDKEVGIQVLKEPSSSSNVAELELLMDTHLKKNRRRALRREAPSVHSIDDAKHRPKEIDQWIESVAKVQSSMPFAQVVYKKSMPTLESLMELWPEEMKAFLAQNPASAAIATSLSKMDATLDELVKIVCIVLDIPVYEGSKVQSLHLLFSLYHEIEGYERDMEQQRQEQQQQEWKSIR